VRVAQLPTMQQKGATATLAATEGKTTATRRLNRELTTPPPGDTYDPIQDFDTPMPPPQKPPPPPKKKKKPLPPPQKPLPEPQPGEQVEDITQFDSPVPPMPPQRLKRPPPEEPEDEPSGTEDDPIEFSPHAQPARVPSRG
jgi:hypothetical protein